MLPDLARRAELIEIMDTAASLPEAELSRALGTLAFVNRALGGNRIVFSLLEPWLSGRKGPVTVLDVGTGGADLAVDLSRWGAQRGFDLRVTGLDSDPAVVRLAHRRAADEPRVEVVEGSLIDFAAAGKTFDVVLSSLMLHHVPEPDLDAALKAMDALCSGFLLVCDLRRCAAGWLGAVAVTAFAGRVSRHDGPVSVRRAFTDDELAAAARRAGLSYASVRRHHPFRLTLSGAKHG